MYEGVFPTSVMVSQPHSTRYLEISLYLEPKLSHWDIHTFPEFTQNKVEVVHP